MYFSRFVGLKVWNIAFNYNIMCVVIHDDADLVLVYFNTMCSYFTLKVNRLYHRSHNLPLHTITDVMIISFISKKTFLYGDRFSSRDHWPVFHCPIERVKRTEFRCKILKTQRQVLCLNFIFQNGGQKQSSN